MSDQSEHAIDDAVAKAAEAELRRSTRIQLEENAAFTADTM
jgi:hypothetical protein